MNGYKSGVAKRLQDELKKIIPYIHCFNHRLHLVIIALIKSIPEMREFFDQLQLTYTTFRKPKIKKIHDGISMKRLIETRWTGHKNAAKCMLDDFASFVQTLRLAKKNASKAIGGEDVAVCIGFLAVITRKKFAFILIVINKILSVLEPADTIFQKREIGYKRALSEVDNMDINDLKPLQSLGIHLPSESELKVAKKYIDTKRADHDRINAERVKKGADEKELPRFSVMGTLHEAREPFPEVYRLFVAIETFACSTAICECSFSSLSLVDTPKRFSMKNKRLRNLAFLGFEKTRSKNIDLDDVLLEFNNKKDRKVQLF